MFIRLLSFAGCTMLALVSLESSAQTMKPKYDRTCLDNAGKAYIQCMADARSEQSKNDCQKEKEAAEKNCKI